MLILDNPAALREKCKEWHQTDETIALVPTMGYYHAGHAALIQAGRKLANNLVVSLFVNPAQFGPGEDLAQYPRDLERDAAIAEENGADILFAPAPEAMYRAAHATWVEVPEMGKRLCGQSRPTHFRGVCTIVLKLLMLTQADFAIFGEKDWQQQAILKRMVSDLDIGTELVTVPTVREADGLAMSSRNVYLTEDERRQAPHIRQGLERAKAIAISGETDVRILRQAVLAYWAKHLPTARLDYLSIVDPDTLDNIDNIAGTALMACAVRLGKARLIDNLLLSGQSSN